MISNLKAARWAILAISLLLHLASIWFGLNTVATPMGDITNAYQPWFEQFVASQKLPGINSEWVYPFLALPAILIPGVLGQLTGFDYQSCWLFMSVTVDLAALWILVSGTNWRHPNITNARLLAGYGWIGLQFMLGPVAISRLDNLSLAVVVVALSAIVENRTKLASVILTLAVWVKIWPVALLLAQSASSLKKLMAPTVAAGTSLILLGLGFIAGGNQNLMSFLTAQTDRGIQIEAPISLPWLWQQVWEVPDTGSYYSQTYLTFQVQGQGVELTAHLMSYALLIALAITISLAYLAGHNGSAQKREQVFAWVALTATLDLIVFNKVGSPQYQAWLIAPVLYAILNKLSGWRTTSFTIAALMPLTWLIYPVLYDSILMGNSASIAVLTARNLLLIALLVMANTKLTRLALAKPKTQLQKAD